jgi:hypothetical protein
MAILSPFFADTVTISRCISVGSCTFKTYLESDGVMCIGGVRDGEGVRLARAVGDGMVDADIVEDRDIDFDVTRRMEGSL